MDKIFEKEQLANSNWQLAKKNRVNLRQLKPDR
jgi:hypothetical protein